MKLEHLPEFERIRARTLMALNVISIIAIIAHMPIFIFSDAYEGLRLATIGIGFIALALFTLMARLIQRGDLDVVLAGIVIVVVGSICSHILLLNALAPTLWLLATVGLLSFLARRPWQVVLIAITIMACITIIQYMFMNEINEESLRDEIARISLSSTMLTALAYIKSRTHIKLMERLSQTHKHTQQAALEAERHHRELLDLLQEARASEQFKSRFLEDMSHELRTPLDSILGYTELLYDELDELNDVPETVRSDTEMIQIASNHLLSMIVEVLDLERIDEASHQFTPTSFDVLETIQEVSVAMGHAAQSRRNMIVIHCDQDSLMVCQDPIWVRQLLFNFISNAIKFTSHGLIEITVRGTAPRHGVCLIIADTGQGMSTTDLEAIQEEFTQASHQSIKTHGGTGLGLPLCYALVERMHGTLRIESTPGQGTTVYVDLPDVSPRRGES